MGIVGIAALVGPVGLVGPIGLVALVGIVGLVGLVALVGLAALSALPPPKTKERGRNLNGYLPPFKKIVASIILQPQPMLCGTLS